MALALSDRERQIQKGARPAAGLGPDSVCKEILGIARFQKRGWGGGIKRISEARIIFYPCSAESEQKVVALKGKVHVSPANTLCHRDAMLHNKAAVILPILQYGVGGCFKEFDIFAF